jgi:RHS repeat-associated protein
MSPRGTGPAFRYAYVALGRRIQEPIDSSHIRDLYFSKDWQVLEERDNAMPVTVVRSQYVWSPVYVDALVLRDRDPNGTGTFDERLYVQQDANWNVTAVVAGKNFGTTHTGDVVERYVEDPYGQVTFLDPTSWLKHGTGPNGSSSVAWVYLHQGGRLDTVSGLYNFRYRDYSPTLGRWMEQDPVGFAAGDSNLHRGVADNPVNSLDPGGLVRWTRDVPGGTLAFDVGDRGINISFTGPRWRDFRVKQFMQIEIYAIWRCPGVDANGRPCFNESEPQAYPAMPQSRNLEDPLDDPHPDHRHETATPQMPDLQQDHGGRGLEFSRGKFRPDPNRNTNTYIDNPTTARALFDLAVQLVLKRWGDKKTINGKQCTLGSVRVVQRFVTIAYLGNDPISTVHWTSSCEGPPGQPGQLETNVINRFDGAPQNPVDALRPQLPPPPRDW